jgi:hypothetical protein
VLVRPSGKVRLSADKAFKSGDGKMKSGARRELSWALQHLYTILNFIISLLWGEGGAA